MRIVSLNVCGIRSAAAKGAFAWLARQDADCICLQETRCHEHQLAGHDVTIAGYQSYFYEAKRKGYAGVAIYARRKPDRVVRGFGAAEFDDEGRYLELQFGALSVASVYLPSGSAGPHRQESKNRFLGEFMLHLQRLRRRKRQYIICGDWNIAHKQIDIRNWKSNQKNSGFLPEERSWLDQLFGTGGYTDGFRQVNQEADQYTWWSNRGAARAKNVGWRIDYHVLSRSLADSVRAASIHTATRFSDHAPLTLDYEIALP